MKQVFRLLALLAFVLAVQGRSWACSGTTVTNVRSGTITWSGSPGAWTATISDGQAQVHNWWGYCGDNPVDERLDRSYSYTGSTALVKPNLSDSATWYFLATFKPNGVSGGRFGLGNGGTTGAPTSITGTHPYGEAPTPTPTPDPTATPIATATPIPTATPLASLAVSSDRTSVAAGGWSEERRAYEYLDKETGQWVERRFKPDPHIATVTARLLSGEAPVAGAEVVFGWDMPGPAPSQRFSATTDADGYAFVDVVSGDEISPGPVRVTIEANGLSREVDLGVVAPRDNWSPIAVLPDSNGRPTIRLALRHDDLPVSGHPISWGIDRILDRRGRTVAREQWGQYVTLSGPLSTTNAVGEAVAYLRFGRRSGTVFYKARDGVVFQVPSASSATLGALGLSRMVARTQKSYRQRTRWYQRPEVEIESSRTEPGRIELSGNKRLFVVRSTFRFRYEPAPGAPEGARTLGVVHIQTKRETLDGAISEAPLEIEVPLDGSVPTARVDGRPVPLSASDAEYYRTFALEFLKELHASYESGEALEQVAYSAEGYGLAMVQAVRGVVQFNPLVLPFTIVSNRQAISNAINVSINGAEFIYNNRAQMMEQVNARLSRMPSGIRAVARDPRLLVAKMSTLASKAGSFSERNFDALADHARRNPNDFAHSTGYVAGLVSTVVVARHMAVTGVGSATVPGPRTLLGTMPLNASTRLLNITRRANVLIRETDTRRFRPLVQKVLSRATFSRSRQSGTMVGEAETTEIIGAVGSGWTTKLRMRLQGSSAQAEVGARQTDQQIMGSLLRSGACFPAGTLILMSDGQMRPIESIEAGDTVASRDEDRQQNSVQRVLRSFHRTAHLLRLRLSNGQSIEATPEHPFFVQGKGFRAAKYLTVGMMLLTLHQPLKLAALEELPQPQTVYNFEVENTHTYFVGSSALWVHNQCGVRFKPGFVNHLIKGDGVKRAGNISGAHNRIYFWNEVAANNITIRSRNALPIPGFEQVRYYGAQGQVIKKTIYDPAYHSDADVLRWVFQAYQDSVRQGLRRPMNRVGTRFQWWGFTNVKGHRVYFEGYEEVQDGVRLVVTGYPSF